VILFPLARLFSSCEIFGRADLWRRDYVSSDQREIVIALFFVWRDIFAT
jgi:hypothetical protein